MRNDVLTHTMDIPLHECIVNRVYSSLYRSALVSADPLFQRHLMVRHQMDVGHSLEHTEFWAPDRFDHV
jgi:hypothetical protein